MIGMKQNTCVQKSLNKAVKCKSHICADLLNTGWAPSH